MRLVEPKEISELLNEKRALQTLKDKHGSSWRLKTFQTKKEVLGFISFLKLHEVKAWASRAQEGESRCFIVSIDDTKPLSALKALEEWNI